MTFSVSSSACCVGRQGLRAFAVSFVAVLLVGSVAVAAELKGVHPQSPDFESNVLPILRRHCFECHGSKAQEADLRLDQRQAVFDHPSAITPGDATTSELYRRVTLPAGDPEIMPAIGKPLSKSETELLRRWIDAGAAWPADLDVSKHWAYEPPVRPALPPVSNASWPRNAIDHFVAAKLDAENLKPSSEADKATIIRRVYLDLIGLPPTPDEVDAFLTDDDPHAYEKVVDQLLASPQFGERWARPWLDLARYADSHGFQRDDLREIWAYRDWVIRALNADMPFDQFTIEQLAGDLLPNASEEQQIATGFHRCAMTNVEAGSNPEETRTNQVIDRVNTTATVWLGSTLECAQCHDHKFDPFTQKEYYQLFAFFNNTQSEAELKNPKVPGSIQFIGPSMPLNGASSDTNSQLLRDDLADISRQIARRRGELKKTSAAWEKALLKSLQSAPREHVLTLTDFESAEGAAHRQLDDGSVLLVDDPPDVDTYTFTVTTDLKRITAFKLEALTDDSLPGSGPGRGDTKRPNFVLNTFAVEAAPHGSQQFMPVKFSAATADYSQRRFDVTGAIDNDPATAWAIGQKFFEPHWAQFVIADAVDFDGGATLRFRMVQNFGNGRTIGRFRVLAIIGNPNAQAIPDAVARIVRLNPADRSKAQQRKLDEFQAEQDAKIASLKKRRADARLKLKSSSAPTTLVMSELDSPRSTAVFTRGDFRQPGAQVRPDVPAVLHPFVDDEHNRLGLAKWLVDRQNPLVARVTVNRWWAETFGHGLVETVEDFGIKGQPPTHPKLLDWLAVEFMDNGWSMKRLLRTIVTSATYRQASNITPHLLETDDQNKLYARGPRLRMDAEMIRDNALSIAGLLSKEQFGPPIRPFQPPGIWTKVGGIAVEYRTSPGDDRYRRGIYVVIKRGSPYPSFVNFDGSGRLACTAKRSRSNTPLQALTLLNDPVYVEATQALALRTLHDRPTDDVAARIDHMFRICLSRDPSDDERIALRRLYDDQVESKQDDEKSLDELTKNVAIPNGVTRQQYAAWYAIAVVLLNLDETITKG
jgi:hypothetical protein